MSTPYIGFSGDQLENQPDMVEGMEIICPQCGLLHTVEFGKDTKTRKKTNLIGFYKCGESTRLAGVGGKLTIGLQVACSGEAEL